MRRSRITITLDSNILAKIDKFIDKKKIRNRSHAIEYILNTFTTSQVNQAVILAGGRGTQLRPYTYELPKPLLPVRGKPILEHLISQLKKNGITEIIISISYLGNKIKEYFGDGSRFGVHIVYSEEQEELMTGGALKKVQQLLRGDTFLVVHGDILTRFAFADFIQFHKQQEKIATVALTPAADPSEYGQIKMRGASLVEFYPHRQGSDVQSHLVHSGIYAFDPALFDHFPAENRFSLEDIVADLVKKKQVSGYVFEAPWFDVGNPRNYEAAIKSFPTTGS